jgi:hypothetical protein
VGGSELIGGRYEPLDVLGEGGQGRVLRCRDHHHDRVVALKVRQVAGAKAREQALTEARTLLALEPHRGIAVVRDDFFTNGDHVLVMEHVDGEDLARRLRGAGTKGRPLADVQRWIEEVASALDHLHAATPPVVHGDVKPANIVVADDGSGRAVLVDFGLAGATPRSRATRRYAAPEMVTGGRSPAADIYALATSAYELLSGRTPVPGARPPWPGLPEHVIGRIEEVLATGLALDPTRRAVSAGALAADLRAAVEDELGPTAPIVAVAGVASARPRSVSRVQWLQGVAVAVLLAGVLSAVGEGRGDATGIDDVVAIDERAGVADRSPEGRRSPESAAATTTTVVGAVPSGEEVAVVSVDGEPTSVVGLGDGGALLGGGSDEDGGGGGTTAPTTAPARTTPPTVAPTTAPVTSPPTTAPPIQDPLVGRVAVYQANAMDVFALDGAGRPTSSYRQTGFSSWPTIVGVGDGHVLFYRSSDGANAVSRVTATSVDDQDSHPGMSYGFTHVVDVGIGSGRVFFYGAVDGHAGAIEVAPGGQVVDDDGYGFDLPTGYDRVAAAGNGRVVLYRSSDGDAMVVEPRAGNELRQLYRTNLAAGWTVLTGTADGMLVGLDAAGNGAVVRAGTTGFTTVRAISVGARFTVGAPLQGGIVLHDPASGAAAVLLLNRAGQNTRAAPFSTAPGAVVVAVS